MSYNINYMFLHEKKILNSVFSYKVFSRNFVSWIWHLNAFGGVEYLFSGITRRSSLTQKMYLLGSYL